MRVIIVEDESLMLTAFERMSANIEDIEIVGQFTTAEEAVAFSEEERYEIAFLDIELPGMNGVECAELLREKNPNLLIVFITAYDKYLRESNQIEADYYLLKPYKEENLRKIMENMRLLSQRQRKRIYIQTFGRFMVMKDGVPIPLVGKTKEILALIVANYGKEISNEEIYSTVWESREYSNVNMKVYYNAISRLRKNLEKHGMQDLIISTSRGQIANVEVFDCDYYSWRENNESQTSFDGEFLKEYSWGEYILGDIIERNGGRNKEISGVESK